MVPRSSSTRTDSVASLATVGAAAAPREEVVVPVAAFDLGVGLVQRVGQRAIRRARRFRFQHATAISRSQELRRRGVLVGSHGVHDHEDGEHERDSEQLGHGGGVDLRRWAWA